MFDIRRTLAKALLLMVVVWASFTVLDGAHSSVSTDQSEAKSVGIELCAMALAAAGVGILLRRVLSVQPSSRLRRPNTATSQSRPAMSYLWPYPPGKSRLALSQIIQV